MVFPAAFPLLPCVKTRKQVDQPQQGIKSTQFYKLNEYTNLIIAKITVETKEVKDMKNTNTMVENIQTQGIL